MVLAVTWTFAQQTTPLLNEHEAAGVVCTNCHRENPLGVPVLAAACLACHGDAAKLAASTNDVAPNPHASPHLIPPEPPQCETCHHFHRPSENACVACHEEFVFKVP